MTSYTYTLKRLAALGIISLLFFQSSAQVRSKLNFDNGWKFYLGDNASASKASFDDSKWRSLNLPHDWSIEGEFSNKHPASPGGGALPGGIGWYRKTFSVPASSKGKSVFVDFDGVYRNSEVWINGKYLGKRPNGYIAFRYDLSPHLNYGGKNTLAVKVDNSEQPNSRWYSGSGIYRSVHLVTTGKVFVDNWGTFITTPRVNQSKASVNVKTLVKNETGKSQKLNFITTIYSPAGTGIKSKSWKVNIPAGTKEITQDFEIFTPALWSVDNPHLYRAVSRLVVDGRVTDEYETPFGVRYFNFDIDKGFSLNGQPLKIRGVCNHHDLGALGAAFNIRAAERQLGILKDMGCIAIRTAHNPPPAALLDL